MSHDPDPFAPDPDQFATEFDQFSPPSLQSESESESESDSDSDSQPPQPQPEPEQNEVAYWERATQAEIDQRFHNMAFWAPKQIAWLSFFFTPVFGAMLYLKNAQTVEDTYFINAAWRGLLVALIGAVLCIFKPAFYLVFYAVWFFICGKEQMNLVHEVWGDKFVHKPWGKPIGIACGIILAMFGAAYLTRIYEIDWRAIISPMFSG